MHADLTPELPLKPPAAKRQGLYTVVLELKAIAAALNESAGNTCGHEIILGNLVSLTAICFSRFLKPSVQWPPSPMASKTYGFGRVRGGGTSTQKQGKARFQGGTSTQKRGIARLQGGSMKVGRAETSNFRACDHAGIRLCSF